MDLKKYIYIKEIKTDSKKDNIPKHEFIKTT